MPGKSVTCLVCIFFCTDDEVLSSLERLNKYNLKRRFAKDLTGNLALPRDQAYQTTIRRQRVLLEEDTNKKPFKTIVF